MDASNSIAVIGMGCRFPGGVRNPEELWSLLSEEPLRLGKIPGDRWNADAFYNPDPEGKGRGQFYDGVLLTGRCIALRCPSSSNILPYEARSPWILSSAFCWKLRTKPWKMLEFR